MPRCPKGTRKNKKTGECEPYEKKKKEKSASKSASAAASELAASAASELSASAVFEPDIYFSSTGKTKHPRKEVKI